MRCCLCSSRFLFLFILWFVISFTNKIFIFNVVSPGCKLIMIIMCAQHVCTEVKVCVTYDGENIKYLIGSHKEFRIFHHIFVAANRHFICCKLDLIFVFWLQGDIFSGLNDGILSRAEALADIGKHQSSHAAQMSSQLKHDVMYHHSMGGPPQRPLQVNC